MSPCLPSSGNRTGSRLFVQMACSEWSMSRLWRSITGRESCSEPTGNDHLSNKPVIHREQVPGAIRIPPTLMPAPQPCGLALLRGLGVRTSIVWPMRNWFRRLIPKTTPPAACSLRNMSQRRCQGLEIREQKSRIENSHLTLTDNPLPYGCG
jgi:hypothetical protein